MCAGVSFKPCVTFFGKASIAGQMAVSVGLGYVLQLAASHVGLVERNHLRVHSIKQWV